MRSNLIKNAAIILSLCISVASITLVLAKKEKQVYVDTGKLFSEFNLSKESNKKLEGVMSMRKQILDSLYNAFQDLSREVRRTNDKDQLAQLNALQEEYYYKKGEFEKADHQTSQDYSAKIWSQLNQYTMDYGKEQGYVYIYGATGEGNIMYAQTINNITDQLIEYVNKRYEDKN